jgi:serine/threonine protein kinase
MSDPGKRSNTNSSSDADDHDRQPTLHGNDSIDASSISPNSIEGLFLLALQKTDSADRESFLNEACRDDDDRRRRVEALLRAFNEAGSFMETPAGGPRPQQEISLSFLKPASKEGVLGMIGPYEVLEVIGRGGMGVVLRAVDLKLNRVVAVKALLPELAVNPNSRRRFLREAQAAAAISHPHVVTIHAVDDTHEDANGKPVPPYLVMECVVGQSLQQKLDRVGTLRLAEILRISRQVGEGLAAAHKQGLIHRDIKPANILLENGVERVKITDFGLARAIDDITVTRTGEVCGTPQYMSPEQASGERVDHRSDLFSLGCVMYAMCTGHSPFRGDSIAHVIKRVTQDTPRSITDQNPEIPPWLIEIITCLLQKNPENRFQSAEGLVVILDQHLSRIQHPTESGSHLKINQNIVSPILVTGPRDSTHFVNSIIASNRKAWLTGTCLVGTAAMIVFGLVAWMMLVGAGAIDAPVSVRNQAGLILAVSMSIAAVCMIAGMLLREEIIGHAAWKKLFRLVGYALLGPIGIWLWILKESPAESSSHANLGPITNRQEWGNRILWIAGMAIVLGFTGLVLYANDVAFLRYYRVIDGNSMTIILSLLGIGLVLAFVGGLLKGSSEGGSTSVLAFYLLLGPLGIVLWLMDRERRERVKNSRSPLSAVKSQDPGSARMGTVWILLGVSAVVIVVWLTVKITNRNQALTVEPHLITAPTNPFVNFSYRSETLTDADHHMIGELVAQRFHKPVISVTPKGCGIAQAAIGSDGEKQTLHLKWTGGSWDLDPSKHATTIEIGKGDSLGPKDGECGGLILDTSDAGLHVALIGSGPRIMGFTPPLIPAGRHKVPVGAYFGIVFDSQAGWLQDVKSNPQGDYESIFSNIDSTFAGLDTGSSFYDAESGTYAFAQYTTDPVRIEVKPGEFSTLTARRDLRKISDGSAYFNRDGKQRFVAGQFYRFLWNSEKFSLSSDQGIVVDILLKRLADGQVETPEREVLDAAFEAGARRTDSVQTIFNLGNHPAWNKVVRSESKDDATVISIVPLK